MAARSFLEFLGISRSFESISEVIKLKSPRNFNFFWEFSGVYRTFQETLIVFRDLNNFQEFLQFSRVIFKSFQEFFLNFHGFKFQQFF
jgi:hypothetical protein